MRNLLGALLLGLIVVGCAENDQIVAPEPLEDTDAGEIYFPGRAERWESKEAADAGFDPDLLQAAVDFALANDSDTPTDLRGYLESRFGDLPDQEILGPMKNRGPMAGMIVHKGYIVAEWGDTEQVEMAFSVTQSFLATTIGLALDREFIGDLADPVAALVDDGGYDSAHNAAITWHQTLRQTSEWRGVLWDKPDTADRREGRGRQLQPPGSFWEHNDVRVNRAALSALRVWGIALPDVLDRELMSRIGASRSWRWHGYSNSYVEIDGEQVQSVSGGGHWGGGMWISTRDLARFGYLYLREGMWRGNQLLSWRWVRAATAAADLNPNYGYMWWVNANGELWPSVPETSFAARGGGDHLVWVDPEHSLVVVVRWIQRGAQDELLRRVLEALGADEDE